MNNNPRWIAHKDNSEELYHFGILGMKWGVRRFQKKDGALTPEGRERYSDNASEYRKEYAEDKGIAINSTRTTKQMLSDKKTRRKDRIAELSDEEVTAMNKRAMTEVQLRENMKKLYPERRSVAKKAFTAVKTMAVAGAVSAIKPAITNLAAKSVKKLIAKPLKLLTK